MVRADIDRVLTTSAGLPDLFAKLEGMGYMVKCDPNVAHTALRPPGGQRFVRLDSLGERYTEENLQGRIEHGEPVPPQAVAPYRPLPPAKLYRISGSIPRRHHRKLHGFRALYVKYLYLLGAIPKRRPSKGAAFLLHDEVTKFNRYVAQFKLLERYRIDTPTQLTHLTDALQAEMDALTDRRAAYYRLRRQGEDDGTVTEAITAATTRLRELRRSYQLCAQVQGNLSHIQSQVTIPKEKERGQIQKEEKRRVKDQGYRSR